MAPCRCLTDNLKRQTGTESKVTILDFPHHEESALSKVLRFSRGQVTTFRDYGGFAKATTKRHFSKDHRTRMAAISAGVHLPDRHPRLGTGSVAAVTMVRNEEDVIEQTVNHLLKQGVDYVLIADNNSTDSTPEILAKLSKNPRIGLAFDSVPAYFQSEKMENLTSFVRSIGATWVIPFDADEYWYAEGQTVASYLRNGDGKRFPALVHNAFPTLDSAHELWVDESHEVLPKTAFKSFPFSYPTMGNHFAGRPGQFQGGLHIIHHPWRSKAQIREKSRNGSLALKLAGFETQYGSQWTGIDDKSDLIVDQIWESILRQEPDPVLGLRATGPFHLVDPRNLSSWNFPTS